MNYKLPIKDVMVNMDPEYRKVLWGMLAREGAEDNITVGAALDLFPPDRTKSKEEGMALVALVGATNGKNKFAAKLTFQQRCEILGLHRMNIPRDVLAKMYNVDRRTITHVHNLKSTHYRDVREEELRLGRDHFNDTYVTPEVHTKALSFVQELRKTANSNNKYASAKQGLHIVRGPMCSYDHRVKIDWIEAGTHNVQISGWYYKDLDSDFPDSWLTPPDVEDATSSSQACYNAMLGDITDKLT